jgi:FkbM family methyltransferase
MAGATGSSTMITTLWNLYAKSPAPVRNAVAKMVPVAGRAVGRFKKSIRVGGLEFALDFSDNAAFRYLRYGDNYEKDLSSRFLTAISLNPRCTVLDIGASYGYYALRAAGIGRFGATKRILAYEPDERCVASLRSSIARNGLSQLVEVKHCLVGNYDGEGLLFSSARSSTSNRSFQTVGESFGQAAARSLPCLQIDTDMSVRKIDTAQEKFVIKIDVEGNEYRVFSGMKRLLTDARGIWLMFEFHPAGIYEVGSNAKDLIATLSDSPWQACSVRYGAQWKTFATWPETADEMSNLFETNKSNPDFVADFVLSRNMDA